MYWNLLDNIPC